MTDSWRVIVSTYVSENVPHLVSEYVAQKLPAYLLIYLIFYPSMYPTMYTSFFLLGIHASVCLNTYQYTNVSVYRPIYVCTPQIPKYVF